jgi:hypothetical protein
MASKEFWSEATGITGCGCCVEDSEGRIVMERVHIRPMSEECAPAETLRNNTWAQAQAQSKERLKLLDRTSVGEGAASSQAETGATSTAGIHEKAGSQQVDIRHVRASLVSPTGASMAFRNREEKGPQSPDCPKAPYVSEPVGTPLMPFSPTQLYAPPGGEDPEKILETKDWSELDAHTKLAYYKCKYQPRQPAPQGENQAAYLY